MMTHQLSQDDWNEFIAVCYFGSRRGDDWLDRCIRRAYLDMSRTLHGMAAFGRAHPGWQTDMTRLLRQQVCTLTQSAEWTQEGFDSWHAACVASLQVLSDSLGYIDSEGPSERRFTVGQAQKWINMSIKYAVALGNDRVPGFSGICPVAHAALDSIVVSALVCEGMKPLDGPWSRLNDYGRYMGCQMWIRARYPGEILLETENRLWLHGQDANSGDQQEKRAHDG